MSLAFYAPIVLMAACSMAFARGLLGTLTAVPMVSPVLQLLGVALIAALLMRKVEANGQAWTSDLPHVLNGALTTIRGQLVSLAGAIPTAIPTAAPTAAPVVTLVPVTLAPTMAPTTVPLAPSVGP